MAKANYTRNAGTWTEAMFFQRIANILRKTFAYWKPMELAANLARRKSQNKDRPKLKYEYQCNSCKHWFPKEAIQIDHIHPVGSLKTYDDLAQYVINLTPEDPASYQVLCKDICHYEKNQSERIQRKERKSIENATRNM